MVLQGSSPSKQCEKVVPHLAHHWPEVIGSMGLSHPSGWRWCYCPSQSEDNNQEETK